MSVKRGENRGEVGADSRAEQHAGASRLHALDVRVRAEDRIEHPMPLIAQLALRSLAELTFQTRGALARA
jgi:hypothetical protein